MTAATNIDSMLLHDERLATASSELYDNDITVRGATAAFYPTIMVQNTPRHSSIPATPLHHMTTPTRRHTPRRQPSYSDLHDRVYSPSQLTRVKTVILTGDAIDLTRTAPKSQFLVDFVCVCVVLASAEACRGIVLPTLSSFVASLGGNSLLLALCVAMFSVGRLAASAAYGWFLDRGNSPRGIMTSAVFISLVGNFLYMMADVTDLAVLVLARICTGFGTGVLTVARTWVANETTTAERTFYMAILGVVQFAGFTLTPIIGGASVDFHIGVWEINSYVFGSWLLLILDLALLVAIPLIMSSGIKPIAVTATPLVLSRQDSVRSISSVATSAAGDHQHLDDLLVREIQQLQDQLPDELNMTNEAVTLTPRKLRRMQTRSRLSNAVTPRSVRTRRATTVDSTADEATRSRRATTADLAIDTAAAVDAADHNIAVITQIEAEHHASEADLTTAHQQLPPASFTAKYIHTLPQRCKQWAIKTLTFIDDYYLECLCVLLNCVTRGVLSIAESFGTNTYELARRNIDDDVVSDAGTFYSVLGALGCIMFLCTSRLAKRFGLYQILIAGLVLSGLGFYLLMVVDGVHLSQTRLTIGSLLIWSLGSPLTQTVLVSIFSLQLSYTGAVQGVWMGWFTAAGSVGRIIAPAVSGALYDGAGQWSAYLFGGLSVTAITAATLYQHKNFQLTPPKS